MTNRRLLLLAVVGVLFASLLGALLARRDGAPGSVLSPAARGWLAARRYAEARGKSVRLMDQEEYTLAAADVLWVVFPWQQLSWEQPARHARQQLRRGGTLVVAYSGQALTPQEAQFLEELGLRQRSRRETPPLQPWRWREERRAEWRLVPADGNGGRSGGRIRRSEWLPLWPAATVPWLRNESEAVVAGEIRQGRGRLILLPSELLCNARLDVVGNADLLERLVAETPASWVFDEYHHGLSRAPSNGETRGAQAFELWTAHLALVYLLAIWALSRRFGPAWNDPPVTTGSARAFFLRIGGLHAHLGHWRDAADVLHSRARELEPGLALPAPTDAGTGPAPFLRFARLVARAQHAHHAHHAQQRRSR